MIGGLAAVVVIAWLVIAVGAYMLADYILKSLAIVRDRIHAYFLRRRMIRAGQDPDRTLTRQERRHLEQRLAKQMRRAAYGSGKMYR